MAHNTGKAAFYRTLLGGSASSLDQGHLQTKLWKLWRALVRFVENGSDYDFNGSQNRLKDVPILVTVANCLTDILFFGFQTAFITY